MKLPANSHLIKNQNPSHWLWFFAVIAAVYSIWVVQPLIFDDWAFNQPGRWFRMPPLPHNGQEIRYYFGGRYILMSAPFSLLKPWMFITAVFSVALIWRLFKHEPLGLKVFLTPIAVLGFPFLGHIGPWNLAASEYTVSALWSVLWLWIYSDVRHNPLTTGKSLLLFFVTFAAATWYESWIVTYGFIVLFLGFDAFMGYRRKDPQANKRRQIFLISGLAYVLVIFFYMYAGIETMIDSRWASVRSETTKDLLTVSSLLNRNWVGVSEIAFMLWQCVPMFLLVLFVKLNKNFKSRLEKHFLIFTFAAVGACVFIYLMRILSIPFGRRTELLCVFVLVAWFYTIPMEFINRMMQWSRLDRIRNLFRFGLMSIAVLGLCYTAYFTYIYTDVDVASWLQYRKMVVSGDARALEGLCCRTHLFGPRSKKRIHWLHEWGEQDDVYRYYLGPSFGEVLTAARKYCDQHNITPK